MIFFINLSKISHKYQKFNHFNRIKKLYLEKIAQLLFPYGHAIVFSVCSVPTIYIEKFNCAKTELILYIFKKLNVISNFKIDKNKNLNLY